MKRILKSLFLASVLFSLIAPTAETSGSPQKAKKPARHAPVRHQPSAAELRAEQRRSAKPAPSANTRRSGALATRRQRAAEMRRLEAKRRAEAARQAAIARQRAIDEGMRHDVQSMIARDNVSGEDPEVRRVAVNALGNHTGTVVVMDPQTGRVYSIVNQEWGLRRGFKPCSTIKLVTGLAGLNEKVIDPLDVTNVSSGNHLNLTDALAYSNNSYFQQVGGRVGFDKMISYAKRLGLGEKTGINAPNEFQGQLPRAKSGFAVNHMSSHGDDFMVTPLQLATLVSAMGNGGRLLSPRVPRTPQESEKFKPKVRRTLNFDIDTLRYMVPGMVGSVNYGSGKRARDPQETVVGKTGTCIEQGTWVGLFVSYAPLANPRLAVVVIARGTDAHGHFPAAVAGRIYRDLNGRFGTPTSMQIAAAQTQSGIGDPKAALNEEEKDEVNEEAAQTIDVGAMSPRSSAAIIPRTVRVPVTNDNVKRVLLPVPKATKPGPAKPLTQTTTSAPPSGTRPRRVSGPQH